MGTEVVTRLFSRAPSGLPGSLGSLPRVPLRSTHGLRSCAASRLNGSTVSEQHWDQPTFNRRLFSSEYNLLIVDAEHLAQAVGDFTECRFALDSIEYRWHEVVR